MVHQTVHADTKFARDELIYFYKNETTSTFKKYVKKLKGIVNIMGQYSLPLYKYQKMDHLLHHITSTNTPFKTKVTSAGLHNLQYF